MNEPPANQYAPAKDGESRPEPATEAETTPTIIQNLLGQVFDEIGSILDNHKDPRGPSSGYPNLDELINGLKPGRLFVIASRPGMGKTPLLHGIATHLALDEKIPGLILTGEVSLAELTRQLLFGRAKVAMHQLDPPDFNLTKGDCQRLQKAAREFRNCRITPMAARALSVESLRDNALKHKDSGGIGFIAIDHIHLLGSECERAKTSRKREFAEVVCGLKSLALELDIPVIALASLKAAADTRDEPCLADLRGASILESEADVIGIIHQPPRDPGNDEALGLTRPELTILKNRTGPTGSLPLIHVKYLGCMEAGLTENQEIMSAWQDHLHECDDVPEEMEQLMARYGRLIR